MHGRYMSLLCSWSSFRYFLSFSFPLLAGLLVQCAAILLAILASLEEEYV